jgi:hypothetical protein
MANTVIQLKFSTATATPSLLNVAEPAYSYTSNTLFIGTPAGTGSIAIGGKFFLDQQANIFNLVNSAFTAANTAQAGGAASALPPNRDESLSAVDHLDSNNLQLILNILYYYIKHYAEINTTFLNEN